MNKNYSHYLIVLLLLSAPFIYLSTFYTSLPATIPTHFNLKGEADGFGSKSMAFFGPVFIGIVSLFTYMVMINIKKIDPKRYENNNDEYFKIFGLIIVAFMSALNMVILTKTKFPNLPIDKLLLPLLGLLFAVMGSFFQSFLKTILQDLNFLGHYLVKKTGKPRIIMLVNFGCMGAYFK